MFAVKFAVVAAAVGGALSLAYHAVAGPVMQCPDGTFREAPCPGQPVQQRQVAPPHVATPSVAAVPPECRFQFFTNGDEKGKALAANAKQECLSNFDRKRAGTAPTLDAYTMWRSHFESERSHRNQALNRSQATTDSLRQQSQPARASQPYSSSPR
jgi:hypothetical protein